jgi:hypothetical protein
MADSMVKYVKTHRKFVGVIVVAIFTLGGLYATAVSDLESVKKSSAEHDRRLDIVEKEEATTHAIMLNVAEDVRIIKTAIIEGNH